MADELKPVDLLEHPEADLSANAEKGAAVGGAAGAIAGAIAGSPFGPAGAAIGAVIGGVAGAVGTGVVVAATDTQGEHYSDKIQAETDATIARNELNDDLLPSSVERLLDSEDI
jgi:phage tail tape-measure protein